MIFAFPGHIDQIIRGDKTQTRRNSDKYNMGQTYAIQPGRRKKGDTRGRILITRKWVEDPGQEITVEDAEAEGGYEPHEYELLYFKMNPCWMERWCYEFEFWETKSILSLIQALKDAKKNPSVPWSTIKSQQLRLSDEEKEDIKQSLIEIESGEAPRFENVEDCIAWLKGETASKSKELRTDSNE